MLLSGLCIILLVWVDLTKLWWLALLALHHSVRILHRLILLHLLVLLHALILLLELLLLHEDSLVMHLRLDALLVH